MEKCRICLKHQKRMCSLYGNIEENISITFAEIIASISNVKVSKNDGMPCELCNACCKSLKNIYEFKCLMERSDIELQRSCQLKRIIFTNIEDVKSKIEIKEDTSNDAIKQNKITDIINESCEKAWNYNGTTLTRLHYSDNMYKKSLSVREFLESIKENPDNECNIIYNVPVQHDSECDIDDDNDYNEDADENEYNDDDDDDEDKDYTPVKQYSYKKNKQPTKKLSKEGSLGTNIFIKPVYLTDIRVARTLAKNTTPKKNNIKKPKAIPKEYMCPHCGKMVKAIKTHMLTHTGERNFKCEICSKGFLSEMRLKNHQKCHGEKKLKCDLCVAVFSSASSFKNHLMSHTDCDRKFACEICGKKFRSRNHVQRHCQGFHNVGIKQYTCKVCSISCLTNSNLKNHMRVHTGERPYKCEICSQPYSYKPDFNRHCLKKHGVFLKSRPVYVLNQEVLVKEQALIKAFISRVNGIIKDDKPINPFKGPHANKAFELAMKALKQGQIQMNV